MSETIPSTAAPAAEKGKRPIRWTMVALWAAVLGVLALLAWGLLNTTAARPEVGQPAPTFDIEFFNGYEWEGKPVANLSEMRGRPVVLNFWASWCVECRLETDLLEQASRDFADEGVVFLAVAYADVEPKSIAYMEEFGVTFPHAPDLGTDISQLYEITGVPETFFIDRDGVIRHVQIGPVNQQLMDQIMPTLLAQ